MCLNHDVYDEYSGADFPAGRQRLDAAQALAFVRQRHGLQNGDLDRTHRQQAFLLSIMHELQDSGALDNLDDFRALMAVARKDVVLSQGWGEEQFRRLASLAGGDVEFRTLPVVRYENIDGSDVNIVDPAAIRAEIHAAIGGSPTGTAEPQPSAPNPDTVVAVVNATETYGLAATAADVLGRKGYTIEEIRDRKDGEPAATVIDYGRDAEADANAIADILNLPTAPKANPNLPAGEVRVILGPGYEIPNADPEITEASGAAGPESTPAPDPGAPIDGGGVPCVN